MLCTFYYDVVTAVCQLLINEYVMLCYVKSILPFAVRLVCCGKVRYRKVILPYEFSVFNSTVKISEGPFP